MTLIDCIPAQHDLRLILIGALLGATACFTVFTMLFRSLAAPRSLRLAWLVGAGAVFGSGVFATHFIGALAFQPRLPVAYDAHATLLALTIACGGSVIAVAIYMLANNPVLRILGGGLLLGATIALTHLIGMHALRLPAAISFDSGRVATAMGVDAVLSVIALGIGAPVGSLIRRVAAASCLLLAICGVDLVALGAVTIVPGPMPQVASGTVWGSGSLAVAVATVSSAILLFSLLGTVLDQHRESQIRHIAYHDALTGLPNRILFNERLALAIETAQRTEFGVAVMCLDLDKFKAVNDLLGHDCGDELLAQVAERLRNDVRSIDTVARLGGDEFAIVQPLCKDERSADALAQRIASRFAVPFELHGKQVACGTSIGVARYPEDGVTAAVLLKHADAALYRAKDGDARVCFFEPGMQARMRQRRELENDLRLAVQRGEMQLHYQPQFDCRNAELVGFEALLRWSHPVLGAISPEQFIPIAEQSGAIAAIGAWALEAACTEAASWSEPLPVSVNLSPVQFRQGVDLAAIVAQVLEATGLPPARLELEITEGVLIADFAGALRTLSALRATGVRISLDDFGTGYSSLNYLWRFPFDKIKIDRSFVQALGSDAGATAIVSAVLNLAHNLDLLVTAEGVETAAQLQMLREMGCDQAQGYLLGRPAHAADQLIGTAHPGPPPAELDAVSPPIRIEQPALVG
jgi:diguanylate cyclase (GGDEF)-like protein